MAAEYDLWLNRLSRESGIRSSIILFGNTSDLVRCRNSKSNLPAYHSVLEAIVDCMEERGYRKIIRWDSINGMKTVRSGCTQQPQKLYSAETESRRSYDLGTDFDCGQLEQPKCTSFENMSQYILQAIQEGQGRTVFILDFSDFLFGNAAALSERERQCMTALRKAMEQGQSYCMLSEEFDKPGTLIILITRDLSKIPPSYYQNNPLVTSIHVPLPGRKEREGFLDANLGLLRLNQDLSEDKRLRDDCIDALDGFSLREIAQIMKLSRQTAGARMTFANLINLYKYGEKSSPWEELSRDKLNTIQDRLRERVKGQEEAIDKVKEVIIRAYTGFSGLQHSAKNKKPKGSLFFVGPTGVGKTELAKALAEFIFGDENACIRFDMSEYNHQHSDQRLVGAPPGYVGYEAGGQLTNAVRERPFCVLLFDEIEKAHKKILDKFLQILEDGRLTDGKGETVSFSETIIIFTSNLGAAEVGTELEPEEARKQFCTAVERHFLGELGRPELLNRIGNDNIVAFNFIREGEILAEIARSKFHSIMEFIWEKYRAEVVFKEEKEVFLSVVRKADPRSGGRGVLNVLENELITPLSQIIFEKGDGLAGRKIQISVCSLGKSGLKKLELEVV